MVIRGFSLIELLFALTITLIVGMIGFELFRQNERVFQTQNQSLEIHQTARALMFQINDEIRRAGQGVPVYASTFDSAPTEAVAVVLSGSDQSHLRIREGYSSVESTVVIPPGDLVIYSPKSIHLANAALFSSTLGTSYPFGRFVYVWGFGNNGCWSWTRAEILSISAAYNILTVIPRQIGEACRTGSDAVHLTQSITMTLEEAASIYWNGGSVWRATAIDTRNPAVPLWSPGTELARNFRELTFTYYDADDNVVPLNTLADRMKVARIDARIRSSSGVEFSMRGYPRNLRLR